ncbi:esterase [Serratia fonticola]|uniref:Esterase n=1 Tax=Serratia fonticola TaxID=47917 RepID=A0A4V6KTG9_SERFO|nr:esterase [Serratia fonticola]
MIEIHDERVGDVAVIHAVPAGRYEQPLPTIFFYHGYTSSKEVYAYFAYGLAKVGFRVVLPIVRCTVSGLMVMKHGGWRISGKSSKVTSDELPALKTHFEQRGLIAGDRIGVAGASMGGMTTLGAFTRLSLGESGRQPDGVGLLYLTGGRRCIRHWMRRVSHWSSPRSRHVLRPWSLMRLSSIGSVLPGGRCCYGMVKPMMWCQRWRVSAWPVSYASAAWIGG